MTLRYRLTRREIVQSYFRSLAASPKFLLMILIYSVGVGILPLALSGGFTRARSFRDVAVALATMIGAFLFMPVVLFLRGKTEERTFSASAQGISTKIGALSGDVSWDGVRLVENVGSHVLVVGRTGNAFLIPGRAFQGPEHQEQFVCQLNRWRSAV